MIKASESTDYVDPMYATNRAAAQAAGMWTGAYHFARPSTAAGDAVAEADHFAATVKLGAGDLIPALDIEVTGGLTPSALTAWVTAWLQETTTRLGVKPMVYTSPAFWQKYLADTRSIADLGYKVLWVAHWGVSQPTVPAQNWGGHGWTFWQYDDCGTVPGISGCVDLDRYNGTDLRAQAFSIFKLSALAGGQVKQGLTGAATVNIIRTNFPYDVALDVSGLPAGASASFTSSPTAASAVSMQVTTQASQTPTGTYPLTITGAGAGVTTTTKLNLVVIDGLPPTVTVPYTHLSTRWPLGTSSIPVIVGWAASDPSGIASKGLQRSVNAGSWVTLTPPSATGTTVMQSLSAGATYQQRARAADRLGNLSGWSVGPPVRTFLVQQAASTILYHGTWRTETQTSASGQSTRYASAAGASATYTFYGSSLGWVAPRGPGRGSARVYVDGVDVGAVSLLASTTQPRAIVFAANWTSSATHTLKIVVMGTAGHPRVDLDALVFLRGAEGLIDPSRRPSFG